MNLTNLSFTVAKRYRRQSCIAYIYGPGKNTLRPDRTRLLELHSMLEMYLQQLMLENSPYHDRMRTRRGKKNHKRALYALRERAGERDYQL